MEEPNDSYGNRPSAPREATGAQVIDQIVSMSNCKLLVPSNVHAQLSQAVIQGLPITVFHPQSIATKLTDYESASSNSTE